MPTVTATIGGAQDFWIFRKADVTPNTLNLASGNSYGRIGSNSGSAFVDAQLGFNLEGLNLPPGAKLSNWLLKLVYGGTVGSSPSTSPFLVQAVAQDDPEAVTTGEDAYARPRTAGVTYPATPQLPEPNAVLTFDVTSTLQAVVDRPGYKQGDRIVLFLLTTTLQTSGSSQITFWSANNATSSNRPTLTGSYTSPVSASGAGARPARRASGSATQKAQRIATFAGPQDGWAWRDISTTPETLNFDNTSFLVRVGNRRTTSVLDNQAFFCLEGLGLEQGDLLSDWFLDLYAQGQIGSFPNIVMGFTNEDAPARPGSAADLYARPLMPTQTFALPSPYAANQLCRFDITSLMQAVIDRPGYQKDDRLVLVVKTDRQFDAANYQFSFYGSENTGAAAGYRPFVSGALIPALKASGGGVRVSRAGQGVGSLRPRYLLTGFTTVLAPTTTPDDFLLFGFDPAPVPQATGLGVFYPYASQDDSPWDAAKVRTEDASPFLTTNITSPASGTAFSLQEPAGGGSGRADGFIEADVTLNTSGTAVSVLKFRRTDNSNELEVYINSTGNVSLYERSGGPSNLTRGVATGVFVAGSLRHTLGVQAFGPAVKVFVDGLERISYTDTVLANSLATAGQLLGGTSLTRHSLRVYARAGNLPPLITAEGDADRPARTASGTGAGTTPTLTGTGGAPRPLRPASGAVSQGPLPVVVEGGGARPERQGSGTGSLPDLPVTGVGGGQRPGRAGSGVARLPVLRRVFVVTARRVNTLGTLTPRKRSTVVLGARRAVLYTPVSLPLVVTARKES